MVAQQIVASALVVPAALRYFSRADLGFLSWIELRDIFSYSIKVQLSAVSTLVNNQVDVFIIGIMLPLRYVGLYNIGATVALQTRTVISNALVPISNQMSKTFGARGEAAAYSEFERMQGAWVRICTGWFCAIGGTTFFAIEGWFGVRFAVAGYVATVLLLGYMVNMYTGMLTIYLNSSGRPGLEANYGAVSMMINLVLTAALAVVGIWGIVGATAVGTALGSAYLMVLVRKRVSSKVPNFFGAVPVGPGLLTLLISAGLAALVRPHAPSGFLGLVAVGVCCVPGLLFYAGALVGPARLVQVARGDIRAMEAARGALTGWP
jgi:O-antigen/teichoic acid export membrane protein